MHVTLGEFLKILAGTASVLAIIFIGLSLTFGETWITANAGYIFLNGLYLLVIPPCLWILRRRPENEAGFHSPKVKFILESGIIVTEPCEWLGYRTAVSVFKFQDEVEHFVFAAFVINIQSNGLVQLQPIYTDASKQEISRIKEIKDILLIKPGHVHDR